MPEDKQAPEAISAPSAAIDQDSPVKHAGTAGDAPQTEGIAQAQP